MGLGGKKMKGKGPAESLYEECLILWLASKSANHLYLQASLIFRQVRLGNCPQQWQLMGHPRHTRQLLYFTRMSERGGLTSAWAWVRDDLEMRKSYFVRVVIGRNRPVRAATVNGCPDFIVKSIFIRQETTWKDAVAVQSQCTAPHACASVKSAHSKETGELYLLTLYTSAVREMPKKHV